MTFDAWEVGVGPAEDYLMHFRTKGSKNGVRRYQTASGEWTELGLAERRKREGFGESRKERKAAKKLIRAERHQARRQARVEARAAYKEKQRQKSLKGLTDEELQNKIKRLKMEQEYKELNKSPLIKTGADLVTKVLEYKNNKEQRVIDINKQKIDHMRAEADLVRAKSGVKRSIEESRKSKFEFKKAKQERKKSGIEKDANLLKAKQEYKNYTIRGGLSRRINQFLTSGKSKQYETIRKAKSEAEANRIRSDSTRSLRNRQNSQYNRDLAPERRREERLRKQRQKARTEYEKRMKRITSF